MRKLIIIWAVTIFLLPCFLQAQEGCVDSNGVARKAACSTSGVLETNVVASVPTTAATFAAQDATTSIGVAYASSVDLPDGTKVVILDNQTDGDVQVSMDGGTTDHYMITAGDVLSLNLAAVGLITTGEVQTKDGTTASTAGTFYVYSFK